MTCSEVWVDRIRAVSVNGGERYGAEATTCARGETIAGKTLPNFEQAVITHSRRLDLLLDFCVEIDRPHTRDALIPNKLSLEFWLGFPPLKRLRPIVRILDVFLEFCVDFLRAQSQGALILSWMTKILVFFRPSYSSSASCLCLVSVPLASPPASAPCLCLFSRE